MSKFIHLPSEVEAARWFKQGDHPSVLPYRRPNSAVSPDIDKAECKSCGCAIKEHGIIACTLCGGLINAGIVVCPGCWIITYEDGGVGAVHDDKFKKKYKPVSGGKA